MSINRAILLGNVGADPEIRSTQSGDRVATFRMATSESWRDKATGERRETNDWHTVVVFNQPLVGIVEQYVRKGDRVSVEGQIKTRKWQDRDGSDRWTTEIVISGFDGRIGLEGSPRGVEREERGYGTTTTRENAGSSGGGTSQSAARRPMDDDEIPF